MYRVSRYWKMGRLKFDLIIDMYTMFFIDMLFMSMDLIYT